MPVPPRAIGKIPLVILDAAKPGISVASNPLKVGAPFALLGAASI